MSASCTAAGKRRSTRTRLSAALAGLATVAVAATAALGGTVATADRAEASTQTDAIAWLMKRGIAKGYANGDYGAGKAVTRGELATMLFRQVTPSYQKNGQAYFHDVNPKAFFGEPVTWMAQAGISTGYSGRVFKPNAPVTRGELATFVYRLAGNPAANGSARFKDVASGKYYTKPITWMSSQRFANGYADRTFRPDRAVTRGEVAVMLKNSNMTISQRGDVRTPALNPLPVKVQHASATSGWKGKAVDWATAKATSSTTYYRAGGNGPNAYDCSGFTSGAFAAGGKSLPRVSRDQYRAADQHVPLSKAQPGDLVYWSSNGSASGVYHVAVVVEGGKIAHARNPSAGVTLTDLRYSPTNMLGTAGRFN